MKRILSITIALFVMTLTAGVMTSFAASTARKTLDNAAAKVNLSKGAYATFTIKGASFGTQSGSIAMKGNKFNARTSSAIIWFDGKTQWVYNKKSEEVNVSSPKSSQLAGMNPYYFLTLYKKGYKMSQTASVQGYTVHLSNGKAGIKEMYVTVDKAYNIKQIKMKQGQQWVTITVSRLTSKSFSDASFRFNAKEFPKAEVIDLR